MENNDLEDKFKKFWLDRSKEEIIEAYFDSIKNGESLLKRIIKARDYLDNNAIVEELKSNYTYITVKKEDMIEILRGEDDRLN